MSGSSKRWSGWMLAIYLAVMAWQFIWHGFLPVPWGSQNLWLALLAFLPLLIPVSGLIKAVYRSMIWAGLLLMLYFTIGVMELWVNPPQRPAALVQILLTILYLLAFRKRNQGSN